MKKVLPSFVEVNLTFECPNCSTAYYFSQEEIPLNKGKRWYCGCGTEMVFCRKKDCWDGVYKPNITGQPSPYLDALESLADSLDFSKKDNQDNNRLAMECVKVMVDMGFTKSAVESKISKEIKMGNTTKENIVKNVLATFT